MNSTLAKTNSKAEEIAGRVAALDWSRIEADLDNYGCAIAPALLLPAECRKLAALYSQEDIFRSRIVMAR
ncbi:MAG: proline hydroxylase, partial [Verrucomicrobia bacterium]|nr:proline hydroxylase [Verrucomicrobiota bacterium]